MQRVYVFTCGYMQVNVIKMEANISLSVGGWLAWQARKQKCEGEKQILNLALAKRREHTILSAL